MIVLPAVAALLLHSRAVAAAPAPPPQPSQVMQLHKKLSERIDYELLVPTALHVALDQLLSRQGIPWSFNEAALVASLTDTDTAEKVEIQKIERMTGAARSTVLKRLLDKVQLESGQVTLTYVVRRDGVEITTEKAFRAEFYPDRNEARLPPLAYATFDDASLADALRDLADACDSAIVIDVRVTEEARSKVTAVLPAVPLDTAVAVLADMAGLKPVRLGNVYYVTSPDNARLLRKEKQPRSVDAAKPKADSTKPPAKP
jgi:hypothetical protein